MIGETYKEIKDAIPELDNEKTKVISDELDKVLALKRLWKSADGEQLLTVLRNNCSISLRKLVMIAKTDPKIENLLSVIFEYSSNMDLLATIQDISTEEELRTQLDDAVKEAIGR